MLTPEQIQLIKQTWHSFRQVDPMLVGDVFYSRLFEQYPHLKSLFYSQSLNEQYCRFVESLSTAVARIDRPDELAAMISQLGARHRRYGVKPEHYPAVGQALLWTLQSGLGRNWTVEMAQAWDAFYQTLIQLMLNAPDRTEK